MIKLRRLSITILTLLLAVVLVSPGMAYAAKDAELDDPIREVHNVTVGKTMYCFFVTHNVVLTPGDIAEMSDEELSSFIIEESGFYMKKANCKKKGHDPITITSWEKKGSLFLSESDIESIRQAEPVDGDPVKLYMDVRLTTEPYDPYDSDDEDSEVTGETDEEEAEQEEEESEEPAPTIYSTYKKVSPRLLFVAVATETDAASGEDICAEDSPSSSKKRSRTSTPSVPKNTVQDEMLPELKTINMADRSGKPVEDTLKEGEPVTLEWVEPERNADSANKQSIADKIPGGYISLAAIAIAAAALIAVLVIRKKRNEEL